MKKTLLLVTCLLISLSANANIERTNGNTYCMHESGAIHINIDWKRNYIIVNGSNFRKIASEYKSGKKYGKVIVSDTYNNVNGEPVNLTIYSTPYGDFLELSNAVTNASLNSSRLRCTNES